MDLKRNGAGGYGQDLTGSGKGSMAGSCCVNQCQCKGLVRKVNHNLAWDMGNGARNDARHRTHLFYNGS